METLEKTLVKEFEKKSLIWRQLLSGSMKMNGLCHAKTSSGICQGSYMSGKCQGNLILIFFKVRELSGNSVMCQGKMKFFKNIREMSGNFTF